MTLEQTTQWETAETLRRDADPDHRACAGRGWHWGWDTVTRKPVQLRCPCVDERRAKTNAA